MDTNEPKIIKLARMLSYIENPKHPREEKAKLLKVAYQDKLITQDEMIDLAIYFF